MAFGARAGTVRSNDYSAVVTVGPFIYVAGKPDETQTSALMAGEIVIDPPEDWIPLLIDRFPSSINVARQYFAPTHLSNTGLAPFMAGFDIRPIDPQLAQRLPLEVDKDLILFPEEFAIDGIGFGALVDDKLVAGATGALWGGAELEIQVNTLPDYEGRGFAAAVSAALIMDCLSRNITPNWETQNATSARLAERLGYVHGGTYDWLILR